MDVGVGHQYGSTNIGGHATVQQGDVHTSTALNISPGNTFNISVQGNIRCPPVARRRLLKTKDCESGLSIAERKRLHTKGHRDGPNLPRKITPKSVLKSRSSQRGVGPKSPDAHDQGLREQGVHLVNQILQASGSKEQVSLSTITQTNLHDTHALHHLRSTLCESTQTKRGTLLTLVDHARQSSLFPAIASVFSSPPTNVRREAFHDATILPSDTMLAQTGVYGPAQDLVCVFLAMLTMLSCHGTGQAHSNNNHNALTSKYSSGQVSLIAGLITFALARYFCIPSMLQQLSEWTGGSLIILDPFMHELRVPKAHVEHFTLLEAFLRLKLGGTTAEVFIKTDQFNLTLGQRYGRVISKTDWAVKGRVKPHQRVVMSVFIKRQDAKCVECQIKLSMSDSGQFTW